MIPKRDGPMRGQRVILRPFGPEDLPTKAHGSMDAELIGLMSGHPEYARTSFDEAMAEARRRRAGTENSSEFLPNKAK
ncbi:MAG: hypothetical protein ACYC6I_08275 [Bacillota bacterium]